GRSATVLPAGAASGHRGASPLRTSRIAGTLERLFSRSLPFVLRIFWLRSARDARGGASRRRLRFACPADDAPEGVSCSPGRCPGPRGAGRRAVEEPAQARRRARVGEAAGQGFPVGGGRATDERRLSRAAGSAPPPFHRLMLEGLPV